MHAIRWLAAPVVALAGAPRCDYGKSLSRAASAASAMVVLGDMRRPITAKNHRCRHSMPAKTDITWRIRTLSLFARSSPNAYGDDRDAMRLPGTAKGTRDLRERYVAPPSRFEFLVLAWARPLAWRMLDRRARAIPPPGPNRRACCAPRMPLPVSHRTASERPALCG